MEGAITLPKGEQDALLYNSAQPNRLSCLKTRMTAADHVGVS